MKTIKAFFLLIRWPNIIFIILTQGLFYFILLPGLVPDVSEEFLFVDFIYLILSSITISAAGYIINDYFDIQIDKINKPHKVIVDRMIKRRWAIFWHLLLSLAGLIFSLIIAIRIGCYFILIGNFLSVVLLWIYSISLKKKLISGNVIIALLTSWVIVSTYLLALSGHNNLIYTTGNSVKFLQLAMTYAGFAFVITIIREVIKDMEDAEGDRRYDCKTMPIVWGFQTSKVFVAVWIIVTIGLIACISIYCMLQSKYTILIYALLGVLIPLLILFKNLHTANTISDYHRLSKLVKLIMLAGILSMLLFYSGIN